MPPFLAFRPPGGNTAPAHCNLSGTRPPAKSFLPPAQGEQMTGKEGDPPEQTSADIEGTELDEPSAREGPEYVGPFRILDRLGDGGFGVVYLAEQTQPVRRRVALKVIKPGMDSEAVLARFEAERQALAVMDHPCIAKVYDGGTTPEGRPYFVMEYVRGLPITQHCDKHRLSIEERLELFIKVCNAVQHAHSKGVIHRDLKPPNILVEYEDSPGGSRATPKIIDFGIAKALNTRLTEKTIFTEIGQLVGTPTYMSPEQAEGSTQDVDTRADIYSLGVVLYELLAGTPPFDTTTLRQAGYAEMQRIIREVDPPRPSTRISYSVSGKAAPGDSVVYDVGEITGQRRTNARYLLKVLRGDADWVVMKCLEKDRSRRYETANALAQDVKRYLDHEAVVAGPPSTLYKMRKFVRRNRGAVAAAAAITLSLVGGLVGITLSLQEANRQRAAAETARAEAEAVADFQATQLQHLDVASMGVELRKGLLDQRRLTLEERGLDREQVTAGLQELDDALGGVNFTTLALDSLDANIFERALAAVDEQFGDQPLVRARLLQTLAVTMRELGLLEQAVEPQREALRIRREQLGDTHPDTLASIHDTGFLLKDRGQPDEAEVQYGEALAGRRQVLGDEHPDTLTTAHNLGVLLMDKGMLAEAEQYFSEALDGRRRLLGDAHSDTLVSVSNMGNLLVELHRPDEAEALYREALEGRRRVLGPDHPQTLVSLNNLGQLLHRQGKPAEAENYLRAALEETRRTLGDKHPDTLTALNNLGFVLRDQDKLAEAEPYLRRALETRREIMGDAHPSTFVSILNMTGLLRDLGRLEESGRLAEEAIGIAQRGFGSGHWLEGAALSNHARTLAAMERFEEAEKQMLRAHRIIESALGPENQRTQQVTGNLVELYETWHTAAPGAGHDRKAAEWRDK